MLYKKNTEKSLDDALFKNPGCEYRGTPFWSWNCKLTEETLRKQIGYLKEMGFGGFHMHSRAGMATEYLSDEFLSMVKVCNDEGKKRDMLTWLYDEDTWPSGFAGGLVTKNRRYSQRFMIFSPPGEELPELVDIETALDEGKCYFLAAYDIKLNESGELESYKLIGKDDKAEGAKWTVYSKAFTPTGRFNGYSYVDALNPDAIDEFIKITHERYKKALGDEFSKTVPAIFTDEPQFAAKGTLSYAKESKVVGMPWTPKFPEKFKEFTGLDIFSILPEVLWNLPDNRVSRNRYLYHDFVTELFVTSFADRVGKWCKENNILLTGHVQAEDFLRTMTQEVGEPMRSYRSFGMPGIDMLCNFEFRTTAKQAQSSSHQYGKEGVLSELYGVTNWDFDFRGHKLQGDWQAALGVTVRVPHLSWVSMAGEAKRDYPASINYQSPWYKEYKYIEDHFARLNTALTRGKSDVKVGVIHPVESYWINWGPAESTQDVRERMESDFKNLCDWLLFGTIDFDYIAESSLPEIYRGSDDGKFNVGEMGYSAVVVPCLETIRKSTLDALKTFKKKGGKVIFAGSLPGYVDAVLSDEAEEFAKECVKVDFDRIKILDALNDVRDIEIRTDSGAKSDSLIYNMRKDNDCKWLFVAHGTNVYGKGLGFHVKNDINSPSPDNVRIRIKGEFVPVLYNTFTGEKEKVTYTYDNNDTVVHYAMYSETSLLLKLVPGRDISMSADRIKTCVASEIGGAGSGEAKEEKAVSKENIIVLKGRHDYILEEPNVLLLDSAEYALDDGEFEAEEEILRLDNICRRKIGMAGKHTLPQPWVLEDVDSGHTITLRLTINSEIEVKDAHLAIEDAEKHEFTFNGEKLSPVIDGYFTDEAIKTFKLPTINPGANILTVKLKLNKRSNTEWCYVLGDFGVRVEGTEKFIVKKPEKVGYSPLKEQSMPFYGGSITYVNEVETPDCDLIIKATYYKGAVIKVYVDGEDAGYIAFAPYTIRVNNVKKGKHKIEFKLFGNRHNSFGALHNTVETEKWFGPGVWRTEGDGFCYEYRLKDMGILASPVVTVIEK